MALTDAHEVRRILYSCVCGALTLLLFTYQQIDNAEVNRIITDAYRAAAAGLRSAREQPGGVTVESAEAAIEDFQHEVRAGVL